MKNIYVNRVDIEDVDPERLVRFAEAHGWTEFPVKRKGIRIFQRWAGDDYFQVTIPLDRSFSDYYQTLLLACEGLAEGAGVQFKKTIYDFSFLEE